MHRHPWISAVIGIGSNLAMLVMIILVSWTRFLTGDSNTRAATREKETVETEQDEETENSTAASGEENSTEDVPAEIPVRAPRGIIRSIFRSLVMNSMKLLLRVTIGLVSYNANQHETYEPGKLYEITLEQVTEFITSEKRSEDIDTLKTVIMNSEKHDKVFSITSHLPHLIAYNLVKSAQDFEKILKFGLIKYSAGGLRDFSRIAASNEIMWRDIFFNNRNNISKAIDLFIKNLTSFKKDINLKKNKSILKKLIQTKKVRSKIILLKQDTNKPDFGRS